MIQCKKIQKAMPPMVYKLWIGREIAIPGNSPNASPYSLHELLFLNSSMYSLSGKKLSQRYMAPQHLTHVTKTAASHGGSGQMIQKSWNGGDVDIPYQLYLGTDGESSLSAQARQGFCQSSLSLPTRPKSYLHSKPRLVYRHSSEKCCYL